jgi:L-2-hydroxyglutarate oxidase LhgO
MDSLDTVVVGAGVIGLATAVELARRGREVVCIERHHQFGTEISSRNSEVIHAGIYYPRNSLKARLCVSGRERLYNYCRTRNIPHRQTGKLIVACSDAEVDTLRRYQAMSIANGAGELQSLEAVDIRRMEPALEVRAGLWSPHTGIVDSHALMQALADDLVTLGGILVLDSPLLDGCRLDAGWKLRLGGNSAGSYTCREMVNAAGLSAWSVATSLGVPGQCIPPAFLARGHYFSLDGPSPFRNLVYPLAGQASLGIHVTLDLAGQARFGPDVDWVHSVCYDFDGERRAVFVDAIRQYYPGLEPSMLSPAYVGIRPKLVGPGGDAVDFRIDGVDRHGIQGLVCLYGIESPGLTAALAIGEYVAEML